MAINGTPVTKRSFNTRLGVCIIIISSKLVYWTDLCRYCVKKWLHLSTTAYDTSMIPAKCRRLRKSYWCKRHLIYWYIYALQNRVKEDGAILWVASCFWANVQAKALHWWGDMDTSEISIHGRNQWETVSQRRLDMICCFANGHWLGWSGNHQSRILWISGYLCDGAKSTNRSIHLKSYLMAWHTSSLIIFNQKRVLQESKYFW